MSVEIGKILILSTYCRMRQGERSIDFALSSERQWELLGDYYAGDKAVALRDLLLELKAAHPRHVQGCAKDRLARVTLGWVASYPFRWWANQGRDRWRFTSGEIAFMIGTMERLVSCVTQKAKPASSMLVGLRMELYLCQRVIEMRLTGCGLLRQAAHVEHFCQAAHVPSVSLHQILELAGNSA